MKRKEDHSFGIIPLCFASNRWKVFLVQHQAGHWSFPKGHPEKDETPFQTAEREFHEETGLEIEKYLSNIPFIEKYSFFHKGVLISKTVHYFPALVKGTVSLQEKEIKDSAWLSLNEAADRMTFQEGKNICFQVAELLNL